MAFLKRYPFFIAILAICVLAFAAEAFFLYYFRKNAAAEEEKLQSARSALNSTLTLQPAPTAENQAAGQSNVADLKEYLDKILATFQKTEVQIPPTPADAPALMLDIQGYVDRMHALAKEKNVLIPDEKNFGFGMKQYLGGAYPPSREKLRAVFQQKFVLEYILQHLMTDCKPTAEWMVLRSVTRENVEADTATNTEGMDLRRGEHFAVDKLITARSPGAIDTLAFRIEYVGRSESLRQLLNLLKQFELPLVVRSIDVKPAATEDLRELAKASAPPGAAASDTPAALRTSVPSGRNATSGNTTNSSFLDPVIADNYSQFTLVIEFIELVLPKPETPAPAEGAPAAGADGTAAATNGTVNGTAGETAAPANGTTTAAP